MISMTNPTQNQQGYLILETLVTIGILAVGLLGVSAMQVASLKSNYSAVQRGEAAYLISAMSDKMRANPEGVRRGFYDGLGAGTPATGPRNTPQQVAQYDFDIWQQTINTTFNFDPAQPVTAPAGVINCPSTFNCILEINWTDTRAESQLQTQTNPPRYRHIASIVF